MISSYRLGDVFYYWLGDEDRNKILSEHPNTICSKFIKSKMHNESNKSDIDIILDIVLEHINENKNIFPDDISNSTVVHLRLGDVVAGKEWHEVTKRPLSADELLDVIPKTLSFSTNTSINYTSNSTTIITTNIKTSYYDKIYIIGKPFFAEQSSKNYDECIEASNKYVNEVKNKLNSTYFGGGNADIDLCCAVKSKLFVQGRGGYSRLIVEIRKKLNLPSVETRWTKTIDLNTGEIF